MRGRQTGGRGGGGGGIDTGVGERHRKRGKRTFTSLISA